MKRKIFLTAIILIVFVSYTVNVYAGILDQIITQGNRFDGSDGGIGGDISEFITDDVMNAIGEIGNLIFAAVTVILGAKYIWSSAEGKAQVMETLPGFIVAVVFFYLGETLVTWLTGATTGITTSWTTLEGKIIGTINMIVRYAAFGGILFMGLRYMFASAEGKSQIKTNMGGFVIGIMFVFAASTIVDFIISVAEGAL